jgi:hypothetical protein
MKYLPTLILTNGILVALYTGQLRLQTGQWVRCYPGDRPSRFVRVTSRGRTIQAVHPNGPGATGHVSNERFQAAVARWPR